MGPVPVEISVTVGRNSPRTPPCDTLGSHPWGPVYKSMASRASRRHVPHEPAAEQEASDGAGLPAADASSTDASCDTARRSSSAVSRAPRAPHAGDKRPGTDAAEDVVERIEDIVGGHHIADGACENALQPCNSMPRDIKVSVALIARPAERPDLHPILPRCSKAAEGRGSRTAAASTTHPDLPGGQVRAVAAPQRSR